MIGSRNKPYIDMGVAILRVIEGKDGEEDTYEFKDSSGCAVDREISVEVPELVGGQTYIVVPMCTGTKFQPLSQQSAAQDTTREQALFADDEGTYTPEAKRAVDEIFERLDIDMDGGMGKITVKILLRKLFPGISNTEVHSISSCHPTTWPYDLNHY